jgi:HlyD family secretion protein
MRRLIIGFLVLSTVLGVALFARIRLQAESLTGPSGGSGVVEGTEVSLSTRVAARVTEIAVREGDTVAAGDLILRLDCAEPEAALAEGEARLLAARAQVDAAEAGARAAGRAANAAAAQAKASGAQVAALESQRDAASRQVERLVGLDLDVAAANADQTRAQAEGLGHQVEAASGSVLAAGEQASAARDQAALARAQAEATRQSVDAIEASLARARLLVAECAVHAPRAATVESIFVEIGELASPALPVARLVDLTQLEASFYLPNVELARAVPQAPAEVRADAYPDRVFPGSVRTVAAQAEFTPRNIQTRTDRDRLVYRVEIDLPNPDGLLRPGMPVQVVLPGTAP